MESTFTVDAVATPAAQSLPQSSQWPANINIHHRHHRTSAASIDNAAPPETPRTHLFHRPPQPGPTQPTRLEHLSCCQEQLLIIVKVPSEKPLQKRLEFEETLVSEEPRARYAVCSFVFGSPLLELRLDHGLLHTAIIIHRHITKPCDICTSPLRACTSRPPDC